MEIDVIDMFCGCGGVSQGFLSANSADLTFRIIGALDIDPHAVATYHRNIGLKPSQEDITNLSTDNEKLSKFMEGLDRRKQNPLVLIGCAPCQGFSSHRKKDKRTDMRNSLLEHFGEVAIKINPDVIMMENVPDMFADKHWDHFEVTKRRLEDAGYHIQARIYNLAEFGVPQERFRALVLAFKHDFCMPEPILTPQEFQTVRNAIGHLEHIEAGQASMSDPMHRASRHSKAVVELISQIPKDGGNRPKGIGPKCLDNARNKYGGYTDVYGRLFWDKPAVTITARCRTPSCGRFVHPEQNRGLTIREAALLQTFPGDWIFEGPFDDCYKQIGNAVPPKFAESVARHIVQQLLSPSSLNTSKLDDELQVTGPIGPSFSILINGLKKKRVRQAQ
jgi:DNA (cytosine-5)-methyltransferase 1